MYISTSSEVFLNRIPSSRVSWYLDMSFGNDFFFKKTKKCKYTDIFDRYFRFFSEIYPRSIGKMAFQHWFFNIPSSKFIVPDFENIYQYKMIPSFSSHGNFCHNLETLLCPMLLHDLDVLKCAYRCHCLSHNSLHCVCVGFLSHETIAMSPQYSRNCRFNK